VSDLQHETDAHGHCLPNCYACERKGLQERIRFTRDFESIRVRYETLLTALAALEQEMRDEINEGRTFANSTPMWADRLAEILTEQR
jgi:hypothetical protein